MLPELRLVGSHTGTHVDAPWHFLQEGNSIDMEPLDKFIGEAAIIDAPGKNSITGEDFSGYDIRSNDIVLIYTGTGDRRTDLPILIFLQLNGWWNMKSSALALTLPV